ncbi:MAG TPA: hypothetical protein VFA26_21415 [Gemmataceae bacterium]|nr:hypothetical protein [Gemmataceae bacterium]
MRRHLLPFVALLAAGCQLPADRMPLKPLPEDAAPLPYAELLTRARAQDAAATEAFDANNWSDLEDAGRGLEQTARFLAKATDVPARHKDSLAVLAGDLGKAGARLREAAKAKDPKRVKEAMGEVHLRVRALRLEE